jgi:hypothetical protein
MTQLLLHSPDGVSEYTPPKPTMEIRWCSWCGASKEFPIDLIAPRSWCYICEAVRIFRR